MKQPKPTKIITHDGIFHADEVFAVALLFSVFGDIPVVRTRELTQEDIDNPEIWILDVGKEYHPSKHIFDHHQSKELYATNRLVLQFLFITNEISLELHDELLPAFNAISDIDRGGYEQMNGFQVNSLIKVLNNSSSTGWGRALDVAKDYIDACKMSVNQAKSSREIWDKGEIISKGAVRVCEKFPVHWKRYNEEPFLIVPEWDKIGANDVIKEWKLHSINSNDWPIHHTQDETFLHTGKFLGIYKTKLDACYAALLSYDRKIVNV